MASDDLIVAAARLSGSAPNDWKQFIEALRNYSNATAQQCIQSPLSELPRNQGRAQETAHLLGIMEDCRSRADKIDKRRMK